MMVTEGRTVPPMLTLRRAGGAQVDDHPPGINLELPGAGRTFHLEKRGIAGLKDREPVIECAERAPNGQILHRTPMKVIVLIFSDMGHMEVVDPVIGRLTGRSME